MKDKYGYDLAHVSEDLEGVDLETAVQQFINNFEFHGELDREQQYSWVKVFARYTDHVPKEGWVEFSELRPLDE